MNVKNVNCFDDLVKMKNLLDHFTKFIDVHTLFQLFKINRKYEICVEESVKRNGRYDHFLKTYRIL